MLAAEFQSNPRVIFSLMNEPHDIPAMDWINAANAAIQAIRALGATNYISAQPSRWASAANWFLIEQWGLPSSDLMPLLSDPLNKIILTVHQYFDSSFGGTYSGCMNDGYGVQLLYGLTLWLRQNNQHAYLGELGASNDATCQTNIDDTLTFLEANADVWVGWSWWEAGTYNSGNFMSVEPNPNG